MFRLLIVAAVAVMLIPLPDDHQVQSSRTGLAMDSASLAYEFYGDLSTFCARNQDACERGGELVDIFQMKLRVGVNYVAYYLDENRDLAVMDGTMTGSVSSK